MCQLNAPIEFMNRIRKRDLVKIFFRSLYVQAAWNYERMLSLGICYCLIPIVKRLYRDKGKRNLFLKRHLQFFNSHPYMVTFALGAIANLEQQLIFKRWEDASPIDVFKKRIMGPLGAIGDTLFWQLILPLMGSIGVVSLVLIKEWGALLFFLLFNICHFAVMLIGMAVGYRKGFDVISDLSFRGTRKIIRRITNYFSAAVGIEIVILIAYFSEKNHTWKGLIVFGAALVISYFVLRRQKLSIDFLLIIAILSALLIGLIFTV